MQPILGEPPMMPILGPAPLPPLNWRLEVFDPTNVFTQGQRFTIAPPNGELIVQEISPKKLNIALIGANGLWELTAEVLGTVGQRTIRQGQYFGSNTAIASNSRTTLSAPSNTEGVRFGLWNMGRMNIPGCNLFPEKVEVRSWEVDSAQYYADPSYAIRRLSLAVQSSCIESPSRKVTINFWNNVPFEQETLLDISRYRITSRTQHPSYPVTNLLTGRSWMSGVDYLGRLPTLESLMLELVDGSQRLKKRISRLQLQVPSGTYVSNNILATVMDGSLAVDGSSWAPYQAAGPGRSPSIHANLETIATGYGDRLNIAMMFQPLSRVFALSYMKVYSKPRFFSWQNQINRCDVNGDGFVTPIDLLTVNSEPARPGSLPLVHKFNEPLLDVNGDGFFTPIDVLTVQTCLR